MYEDAEGYSFEVDNWALGVIMYTLLAGHAPFYHREQLRYLVLYFLLIHPASSSPEFTE
jgi:serine/threonine protein kinase